MRCIQPFQAQELVLVPNWDKIYSQPFAFRQKGTGSRQLVPIVLLEDRLNCFAKALCGLDWATPIAT